MKYDEYHSLILNICHIITPSPLLKNIEHSAPVLAIKYLFDDFINFARPMIISSNF